jgi:hypothetical protein
VPERWFLFVQLEIPWELGPADGRYLLRGGDEERTPEHVVVLLTIGAQRRRMVGLPAGRGRARGRAVDPEPQPKAVPVTRVTVIDPVPVAAEGQAKAWLNDIDAERETWAAAGVVNRVLAAQRVAAADPYLHEFSPTQALVVRAGWGVGEQVADGQWRYARELPRTTGSRPRGGMGRTPSGRGRAVGRGVALALRSQERLTWVLSGREAPLLCEELALRARRDLDQGRLVHAAVELRSAYAAALAELDEQGRQDMALRVAELRELDATLTQTGEPREETVRHALERLEAALRARSVGLKLG